MTNVCRVVMVDVKNAMKKPKSDGPFQQEYCTFWVKTEKTPKREIAS
jgi:hypothetical protein